MFLRVEYCRKFYNEESDPKIQKPLSSDFGNYVRHKFPSFVFFAYNVTVTYPFYRMLDINLDLHTVLDVATVCTMCCVIQHN